MFHNYSSGHTTISSIIKRQKVFIDAGTSHSFAILKLHTKLDITTKQNIFYNTKYIFIICCFNDEMIFIFKFNYSLTRLIRSDTLEKYSGDISHPLNRRLVFIDANKLVPPPTSSPTTCLRS